MVSIIDFIRKIKRRTQIKTAQKRVMANATMLGTNHNIESQAAVLSYFGASKENIILKSHSELFGKIICWGKGQVVIGEWVKIGFNSIINCVDKIEIGNDTAIADGVTIVDHNYHPINPADRRYMRRTKHGSIERSPLFAEHRPIKIGENVWIGTNVRICKGVTIGDNCVIGANSVVTKNIPANCIAVGIPAKIVKEDIDKTTTPQFPLN